MNQQPAPLAPHEVGALLQAAAAAMEAEVAALPHAALRWHAAPGEWCVKEVLGHLIEAEARGFSGRVRAILAAPSSRLEVWDQAGVARARRDCERDAGDLLRTFMLAREDSIGLVLGLRAEDLVLSGLHPEVGELRVADLLHEWVHHDRNHLRQMLACAQGYAWPHMGNAQRFSQP